MLARFAAARTEERWYSRTTESLTAFGAVPRSDHRAILDALAHTPAKVQDALLLRNVQYHFRKRAGWTFKECPQHSTVGDPCVVPTAFVQVRSMRPTNDGLDLPRSH